MYPITLTNPGEVNTNLFSKIFPHLIQWLTLVEVSPLGPVVIQQLQVIILGVMCVRVCMRVCVCVHVCVFQQDLYFGIMF